jgi:phosphate transport system substrate-binding protein
MANPLTRRLHRGRLSPLGVILAAASAAFGAPSDAQEVRDYISIVGSSTVYPFATAVAEQFGRASKFKTPKIEPTGSGGGIKLFCNGIGVQHPDIVNSSRRITASELEQCRHYGVTEIVEVEIGYDGIVLANSKSGEMFDLSLRDIFLALAKNVPNPSGNGTVPNPYHSWSDVNADLPDVEIEVLGPPPTSGTRDAFLELAMEGGCKTFPALAALKGDEYRAACHTIREDGRYVEAGENDNLIVQKLASNPLALGIFGFSFLEQNSDKVQGSHVEGVDATFENIADGTYPISRPLYFYVKKAHIGVIPGIREYLAEFTSDSASGDFGYLTDRGLVPLPEDERRAVLAKVRALENFRLAETH